METPRLSVPMKSISAGFDEFALDLNIGVSLRKISFKAALLYAVVPFDNPSFEGLAKPSISPSEIRSRRA